MRRIGLQPSSLSLWCLNAKSSRLRDLVAQSEETSTNADLLCILEELSEAADTLASAAGQKSRFWDPLICYKRHVDMIVSPIGRDVLIILTDLVIPENGIYLW